MLNARRTMTAQNNQNNNINNTTNTTNNNHQNQNQYYTAAEKRGTKRGEILKNIGNESQRSRTQRIKQMFFAEQLKYKTDTLPGVFHGKSGGKNSELRLWCVDCTFDTKLMSCGGGISGQVDGRLKISSGLESGSLEM